MGNHLRVCIVAYRFAPAIGGAEKRAEKLARQLVALGHEVTVVTLHIERTLPRLTWMDGIRVIRIGGLYRRNGKLRLGKFGRVFSDLLCLTNLCRLLPSYDVLHVCQFGSFAAVAALVGQCTHTPVVISSQSSGPSAAQRLHLQQGATLLADTLTETAPLHIAYEAWSFAGSDVSSLPQVAFGGAAMLRFLRHSRAVIQVMSTRSYTHLLEQGFSAERILYIPGGVDTDYYSPLPLADLETGSERVIVCVARLDYSKGVDVLLHAWGRMLSSPLLQASLFRPRLLIVGDGDLSAQVLWMASILHIQSSVEFLGACNDIVSRLQHAWGFVLPSRWEGMPNALLEAMSCGLPCIATRVSGSEDIISTEVNGLLVEPEDPSALATALARLLCDDALATRLGEQARAAVLQKYQLASIVNQCLELYQRLLTHRCDAEYTLQLATEREVE